VRTGREIVVVGRHAATNGDASLRPRGAPSPPPVARGPENCDADVVVLLALGGSDCEALRDGVLGQPVNSVSSLAYVAAGAYVLHRGGPRGPAWALALVGLGSVLYHGPMPPGAELVHDASLVAVPLAALGVVWRRRSFPRPPAAAVVALAVGAAVNVLSRTGAPLCRPDSLAQGHAAWHVLTAVGAALWLARWPRAAGGAPSPESSVAAGGIGATPAHDERGAADLE
jgi:hypothetical protein